MRLHSLNAESYNHRVGRVVLNENKNGRLGVALDGCVWPARSRPRETRLFKPGNLSSCTRRALCAGPLPLEVATRLVSALAEDAIAKVILAFLLVSPADEAVSVSATSTRGDFPLSSVLDDDDSTWWISAEGSMPNGRGREALIFTFPSRRLVRYIGIRIPPLPHGPLSVRRFALEGDGKAHPITFLTRDESGTQEFAVVPPLECSELRLLCFTNAAEGNERVGRGFGLDVVGLFRVHIG